MTLKKRKVRKSFCYMMGAVGAGFTLAGGVLQATGISPAALPGTLGFVLCAGMLLVLATTERGPGRRGRRVAFLALALLWVASTSRLPLLDLLEAPAVVCVAAAYRQKGDGPLLWGLGFFEAAFVLARMLNTVGRLPRGLPWLVGALTAAAAAMRLAALLRLYLRARKEPPDDDEVRRLR